MPHYLPDGRIVFSSTRQRQSRAILLDENKPQYAAQDEDDNEPAFVLHVMDADGTNIHQISFNQSHDLDPAVLPNGRIVYTRWEHHIDDNEFDLYSVNPDGSDLQLLYGANSHATGTVDPTTNQPSVIQFLSPRPMQDGRTLAVVRPFSGTGEGGDLVLIDTQNFVDNTAPVASSSGMPGPAQVRALPTDVRTIEGPSPGGRYRSAAPLFDGSDRLLVSWSQCRLIEEHAHRAVHERSTEPIRMRWKRRRCSASTSTTCAGTRSSPSSCRRKASSIPKSSRARRASCRRSFSIA